MRIPRDRYRSQRGLDNTLVVLLDAELSRLGRFDMHLNP